MSCTLACEAASKYRPEVLSRAPPVSLSFHLKNLRSPILDSFQRAVSSVIRPSGRFAIVSASPPRKRKKAGNARRNRNRFSQLPEKVGTKVCADKKQKALNPLRFKAFYMGKAVRFDRIPRGMQGLTLGGCRIVQRWCKNRLQGGCKSVRGGAQPIEVRHIHTLKQLF